MSGWEWVGVGLSRIIFRQTQQRLHPFAAGAALYSFAPPGLVGRLRLMTHGLRRGLHSFAPSGLVYGVCRNPRLAPWAVFLRSFGAADCGSFRDFRLDIGLTL
jgi:hypothetical protein